MRSRAQGDFEGYRPAGAFAGIYQWDVCRMTHGEHAAFAMTARPQVTVMAIAMNWARKAAIVSAWNNSWKPNQPSWKLGVLRA